MKISMLIALASLAFGPSAVIPCSAAAFAASPTSACCKVCKKGKACGDSCISQDKQCHKGPGCACDG